jgi:hypothetical protein
MMGFVFGFLFGTIGFGYLTFGKKMQEAEFMLAGLLLMIFPYFIESNILTVIIGVAVCFAPFIYKSFF